ARLALCSPAEWERIKDLALDGWVRCSDGRLYHPVVAEKAREAWEQKLQYRERKQARIEQAQRAAQVRWSHSQDDALSNADAMLSASSQHEASNAGPMLKGRGRGRG